MKNNRQPFFWFVQMLDSFDDSFLTDEFKLSCEIEDLIFEATDESIEKAKKLLKDNPNIYSPFYLQTMILHASTVRRFSFKELASLWREIPQTKKKIEYSIFSDYLYKEGLIRNENILWTPSEKTGEDILNVFDENSILHSVVFDDLNAFNEKVVSINSSNYKIEIVSQSKKMELHLIDFAALCGAVKIFKELYFDGSRLTKQTAECVIKGGNLELLEILQQQGFYFHNFFELAIVYHRNDIAYWLSENFHNEHGVDLLTCISSFNTSSIPFILSQGANIEVKDEDKRSLLHIATRNDNINLIIYLLNQGADIETKDNHFSTPLIEASKNGFINIVKLYIERGANIDACDYCHQTSLIWAAKSGFEEITKLLLKHGANKNAKDNYGRTAHDLAYDKHMQEILESN